MTQWSEVNVKVPGKFSKARVLLDFTWGVYTRQKIRTSNSLACIYCTVKYTVECKRKTLFSFDEDNRKQMRIHSNDLLFILIRVLFRLGDQLVKPLTFRYFAKTFFTYHEGCQRSAKHGLYLPSHCLKCCPVARCQSLPVWSCQRNCSE